MSLLFALVAGCVLLPAADADKPAPLRYLRPDMGKYVADADVTTTRTEDGTTVVGHGEKMTVTLHYDAKGKVQSADAVREGTRKAVTLTLGAKGAGTLKRGGITDFLKDLPADPVVTATPEWLGIAPLLRRYDAAKGGKQEFPGLWIDPVVGLEQKTLTADRQAAATVTVKDKPVKLDHYRVHLRGGDYAAWTDDEGRVVRVQSLAPKAVPLVLEGYEDATKELKP